MAPKINMNLYNQAGALIEQQYGNINAYFDEANTAFEGQYQNYYGQQMQDSINALAGQGIYDSPISQLQLNRKTQALGETYATAKSQLAGQKMSALGQVDQQKIAYLQNLANAQYQNALNKANNKKSMWGTIGGIGGGIIGTIAGGPAGGVLGTQFGNSLGQNLG